MSPMNGILPVDKPAGPTSHDIVALARRTLGERRIGHTGTLDPFASGLLLLCVGPATRLAEYLTALPKRYEATLVLGIATDTDDDQGRAVGEPRDHSGVDRAAVEAALAGQRGEILQVPPQFSAKRVEGERMYDVARRGGSVELDPVPVTISRLEITRFAPPAVDFEVECSTGTFIRAIARDVGVALGVGAHLTRLRRTRIGGWRVEDAVAADRLGERDAVLHALVPPADALRHFPTQVLDAADARAVRNGVEIPARIEPTDGPVALVDPDGSLVAVGSHRGATIHPRKVFA